MKALKALQKQTPSYHAISTLIKIALKFMK